jgi:glutamate-1-semialdehyde 2,1-aminomutase
VTASAKLFHENARTIPGGVVSINRKVVPEIAFVRGQGAYLWDADGRRYTDYHAAFGPYLLGHGHPEIEEAVVASIRAGQTLTGTGTTPWEGEAAALLVECVPTLDRVVFTNSGSEATYFALRLARAATGREHIVVMQGGYNGWHDAVACNVMTPIQALGPRAETYPFLGMSAGIAAWAPAHVHVVEFNNLRAVEAVFERFPVAAVITEPILQNIGVVKPRAGFLHGLQDLCARAGVTFIIDEVKTGFRHALAGYHALEGLTPDLVVFGKAIANGYPVGAVGGKAALMDQIVHADPHRRVMIAGTYNGHPVPMAATIATLRLLRREQATLYPRLEGLSATLAAGIENAYRDAGLTCTVGRQASAMAPYLMNHAPVDWYDLATHHDMERDVEIRRAMVERGEYWLPIATKQLSVSTAHTEDDIAATLEALANALRTISVPSGRL